MTDSVATSTAQAATGTAGLSPGDRLKQVVTGAAKAGPSLGTPDASKVAPSLRARLSGLVAPRNGLIAAACLCCGLVLGAGATALVAPRSEAGAFALAKISADLDATRAEAARLSAEMERLAAAMAASSQRAVDDAKAMRTDLSQRVARAEQALAGKIASLSDRQDAADKEQAARLAALAASVEKRMSAPAPTPAPAPQAAKPAAAEPVQTGSIAEPRISADAKPKSTALQNWAVREVYDGIAVLEDRKRRLVEVARGDMVPGIGRAESIERRGRGWVVVTREGVITPQEW